MIPVDYYIKIKLILKSMSKSKLDFVETRYSHKDHKHTKTPVDNEPQENNNELTSKRRMAPYDSTNQ